MNAIRQLPNSLINKIAAGEVIERPASVVKELLENCIDAGATQIEVSIDGGGTELIRIADNGSGIPADQMLLAISPHATSKLVNDDDLFTVETLGFRGEALASIAEISHLTMRSRTAEQAEGAELVVRGGSREGPSPCGCPTGTTIEIRNLFFNTPVRKKFLKTPQTEMGHTLEAFTRLALANPKVQMTLRNSSKVLHEMPTTHNWGERIHSFFGSEISDALIAVDGQDDGVRLHGYVVAPSVSRSNNRLQYLFLNGRYIRDRSLQHALGEAYRGLLMVGRFPICFLNIEIPPNQVDVNVHPTKSEVRFLDGGAIYRRLLQTLRSKFLSTEMMSRVGVENNNPMRQSELAQRQLVGSGLANGASNYGDRAFDEHQASLMQWARGEANNGLHQNADTLAFNGTIDDERNQQVLNRLAGLPGHVPEFQPFEPNNNRFEQARAALQGGSISAPTAGDPLNETVADDSSATTPSISHLGYQIHNRYLVTQDQRGMVVIDQHALHERVLYEQIREKVLSKSLEKQRLLIPEPVTLTAAEAALALEHVQTLEELGISIEPFGGDCVLVTAYPAMLANLTPSDILRQVIEKLMAEGAKPESRDLIDSLLHMIACKAAIKAGDKLTAEEITALLEQRHAYQDTHHCPHGRPTALYFSRNELDKMFKRT